MTHVVRFVLPLMLTCLVVVSDAEEMTPGLVGGCVCSDFTFFRFQPRRGSVLVGDCKARDASDNLRFCYVHQPNNCLDAQPSRRFSGMEVSKIPCGCFIGSSGFCLPPDTTDLFSIDQFPPVRGGSGRRRQHITDEKATAADDDSANDAEDEEEHVNDILHEHDEDLEAKEDIPTVQSHEY